MRRFRLPRPLAVLLGIFTVACALIVLAGYGFSRQLQRATVAAAVTQIREGNAGKPPSSHGRTVEIENCGRPQSFGAFPDRDLTERDVYVFACGADRYILMPPLEGK